MKTKAVHAFKIKHNAPFSKKIAKKADKKPRTIRKSLINFDASAIKNKMKRLDVLERKGKETRKTKKQQKKLERMDENRVKQEPLTIDDKREIDENFVFDEDDNDELVNEEQFDEFEEYFKQKYEPKIMLTTSVRPSRSCFDFLKEAKGIFGAETHYWPRKQFSIQQIQEYAMNKQYTDILVFREDKKVIDELILIHLPKGPTVTFKISNIKLSDEISHHARVTDHNPELILNHFNSKVGRRVGRCFAALFPQNPQFKGRRVVTFHNQRDFIFFRHHRYMFQEDGSKAALQEIGPQFTLKLKKIHLGAFDNLKGEIEFEAKDEMYVKRTRVYI